MNQSKQQDALFIQNSVNDNLAFNNTQNNDTFLCPQKTAFLERFHQILEQHYDNCDLTVAELARMMYLSQSQFFRKVKAYTTYNPNHYLRLYRLKKSVYLLQQVSSLTITTIAYEVGFSDSNYFSRAFYNVFGYRPSCIRKKVGATSG